VGPSVSFPVGQFTGGEMVFPQLDLKLQYVISIAIQRNPSYAL
jgi:hypothetical protein